MAMAMRTRRRSAQRGDAKWRRSIAEMARSVLLHWAVVLVCMCIMWIGSTYAQQQLDVAKQDEPMARQAIAWYARGQQAFSSGEKATAIQAFEQAIAYYPRLVAAFNNLALSVYAVSNSRARAMEILEQGARIAREENDTTNLAAIFNNMGFITRDDGSPRDIQRCLEAIEYFDLALQVDPRHMGAIYNKGAALFAMRHLHEAEALFHQVVAEDPSQVSAHIDLASIHFARRDFAAAIEEIDLAIQYANDTQLRIGAMHNKGHFLKEDGQWVDALAVHQQALELDPQNGISLADVVTSKRTLCDWESQDLLQERLLEIVQRELAVPNHVAALQPYDSTLMRLSDTFRKRLAISAAFPFNQVHTLQLHPRRPIFDPSDIALSSSSVSRRPLRIGYLTYDFRDHPMGHLTLGLLDSHDRRRIETYCFSYGPNDASEWRERAEAQCDVFRDIAGVSNLEAAQRIGLDDIDVVVDLMAHTRGARVGIAGLKPSLIVVNYLGYPGTVGSTFTDYALVDRFVLPPEHAAASMTEQVVYLPHIYQVNQYGLHIASCDPRRQGNEHCQRQRYGLPEDEIVFCNFNTIDKMEPSAFAVWMRVLERVPSSVLWLLAPGGPHDNLIQTTIRNQALALGIVGERIIFAPREPKQVHLERLGLADIFLDSFVYNAHSTASDALWANVPIVTMWGDAFPSRVAAAIVQNALDLRFLVPHSVKEYEDIAVIWATNPVLRQRIRDELAQQAIVCPLFDTGRTTRVVEATYELLHDINTHLAPHSQRFQVLVQPSTAREFASSDRTQARLRDAIQLANAHLQQTQYAAAMNSLDRVLRVNPTHLDALHLAGIALFQLDDPAAALTQLNRAISVHPAEAQLYDTRSTILLAMNRIVEAKHDLRFVLAQGHTESVVPAFWRLAELLFRESTLEDVVHLYEQSGHVVLDAEAPIPDEDRERAYLQFSFALDKVGRVEDAIELLETATTRFPSYFRLGYNLGALHGERQDFVRGDNLLMKIVLAEAIAIFDSRGRFFQKRQRDASRPVVVFYCHEYGQSWWDAWGPSSLDHGLGGSEEAVVFLSRQLAALGYWVEVYGNPPAEDIHSEHPNGLQWYPHYAYDPADAAVDFFVAWRYHVSLSVGSQAKHRFFWVHDVPADTVKHSPVLATIDAIICVSTFQASRFSSSLLSKTVVIANGLDTAYFVDDHNHASHFVYGSSPNRGLRSLLLAWPRIRNLVPDARLSVFYGFTPAFMEWGKLNIRDFDTWKQEIDTLLDQPGVEYDGLVGHHHLARAYAKAGFYLYPTTFSETSCISLMKAMANGAIPITSRYPDSALSETCDDFDLGPRPLEGAAPELDVEWMDLWINSIQNAVKNTAHTERHRYRMKEYARRKYRWEHVADQWHAVFRSIDRASIDL